MSLSSASQLQNFFEKQKKAGLKKERVAEASKSLESEKPAQRILLQNPRRKEAGESAQRFSAKTPKRIESEELMQKKESHSLKKTGGSQESNSRKEPAGSSSSVSQTGAVSSFAFGEIREEKEKALSRSQKLDLIERAEGRSSRETEKLLLDRAPESEKTVERREKTRILGNGQVEIKAIVSESCHKKLKELKNLLSHRNPSMGYGGLLEILSDLALDKYDPRRKRQARKNPVKDRQALNSGGNRKRGEKDADPGERPGGRNERCGDSQLAASLQKSQPTEQTPTDSLQKLKSMLKAPADSAASLQKSQQARQAFALPESKERIFGASAPKLWQTKQVFVSSAQKSGSTKQTVTTSAEKSQQARQTSVATGEKRRQTTFDTPLPKSQMTKQDPAASAQKSKTANLAFAIPASEQSQAAQTPDASMLKLQQTTQNPRASAQKSGQTSRYIPAEVKRRVWARDKSCCSYVNPQTGRKCNSRRFLHIDHILPFALGGKATANNLRLLCAGHNQFRARQTFKNASICKKNF